MDSPGQTSDAPVHDAAGATFLFVGWFAFLYVVGALTVGLGGWVGGPLIEQGIRAYHSEATRSGTVLVIVAARDLPAGSTIEEGHLYGVEIPPRYLPEGTFPSPEAVVGQEVVDGVLANEMIREERLK